MTPVALAARGAALRWRLVANQLSRRGGVAVFTLSLVACAVFGVAGFLTLATARTLDAEAQRNLLVLAVVMIVVGWVVVPLLTGGTDETVDPTRLALLPLRAAELTAILVGAAVAGPAVIAVLVAVLGIVVGYAPGSAAAVVTLAAALCLFAMGLVSSRAVAAMLARAQRSRKGRDLALLATAGVGAFLWLASQAVGPLLTQDDGARGRALIDGFTWLPPGWIARSVVANADGRVGEAIGWLALAAAFTASVGASWAVLVRRLLSSPERVADSASHGERRALGDVSTPFGAAMAREWRTLGRSPSRRAQLLMSLVFGCGMVAVQASQASGAGGSRVLFLALWASVLAVAGAFNIVGFDAASLWLEVLGGGLRRPQLAARSLAWLPHVLLPPVLALVGLAVWTGRWSDAPVVLITIVGATAVVLAVGLVASARVPWPVTDGDNPFAWRSGTAGKGCAYGLMSIFGVLAVVVLSAPAIVPALVLIDRPAVAAAVALLGVGWGAALWWLALGIAARFLSPRWPELIADLGHRSAA